MRHFSLIVPKDNAPWNPDPSETGKGDPFFPWCGERGFALRRRAVLWPSRIPPWLAEETRRFGKARLLKRLEARAALLACPCGKEAQELEVLRDALDPGGPEGIRQGPFSGILDRKTLEEVLLAAREAAPGAKLYLCGAGILKGRGFDNAYGFIADLLDRDVPLDGIGLTGRWRAESLREETLRSAIDAYSGLGLEISLDDLRLYGGFRSPGCVSYQKIFQVAADFPSVKTVILGNPFVPVRGTEGLFGPGGEDTETLRDLIDSGMNLAD